MNLRNHGRGNANVTGLVGLSLVAAALVFVGIQLGGIKRSSQSVAEELARLSQAPGSGPNVAGIAPGIRLPGAAGGTGEAPGLDTSKLDTTFTGDHIYGSKDARVSLITFMDFECPYCAKFYPVAKQFAEGSDGKVNFIVRHYPLDFHAQAARLAHAAECVVDQGGDTAFWSFSDKLVAAGKINDADAVISQLAAPFAPSKTRFDECQKSGKFNGKIKAFTDEALAVGITGTPTSILYDSTTKKAVVIMGLKPLEQLRSEVAALQKLAVASK